MPGTTGSACCIVLSIQSGNLYQRVISIPHLFPWLVRFICGFGVLVVIFLRTLYPGLFYFKHLASNIFDGKVFNRGFGIGS